MKKLITAAMALALMAGVASAVESDNIVGYTTEATPAGAFKMLGVVFTPVGDPNGAMSFTNLISGTFAANDEVQILLPGGGYKVLNYYVGNLISADYTKFNLTGWGDSGIEADYSLENGQSFWIKTASSVSITQAGQVQIAGNNEIVTPAGAYSMVSSPYPTPNQLSQIGLTGIQAGDEVQFLLPGGGYKVLNYYVGNLISSDYSQFNLTGWGDSGIQADYSISLGEGFWVKTAAATTLAFPSPW